MRLIIYSLLILSLYTTTPATLITLQQGVNGYNGSTSTRMRDNGLIVGNDDGLFVGDAGNEADNRALLSFDLTGQSGSIVTGDGSLTLTISQVSSAPNSGDFFDAYLVDVNNTGWISAGDSSWNFLDVSDATPWKDSTGANLALATGDVADPTLGALGTPGQGYAATPFATLNQASYTPGSTVQFTVPQAVLQGWIDGPNAGMLFRGRDQTDAGRLAFTHPAGTPSAGRPILSFDVTTIPEPSSGLLLLLGFSLRARRRMF